jgi:anaerobic selenocysteine-containing dehydrogenase
VAGLAAAFGRGSMTNHWADMGNSTNVVIMGANPTENHPASMAHINAARFSTTHPKAKLIVIDPRKTRTALQADQYVRIRPGTDIAFINGLLKYITDWMEANPANPKSVNFFSYLNEGAATGVQSFYTNRGVTTPGTPLGGASTLTAGVKYGSKFTDARFLVNTLGTDYLRENVSITGDPLTGAETPATTIYDFPKKSSDCKTQVTVASGDPGGAPAGTYDTVYLKLKAHVSSYTQVTVADICGCTQQEVA